MNESHLIRIKVYQNFRARYAAKSNLFSQIRLRTDGYPSFRLRKDDNIEIVGSCTLQFTVQQQNPSVLAKISNSVLKFNTQRVNFSLTRKTTPTVTSKHYERRKLILRRINSALGVGAAIRMFIFRTRLPS